ncbi:hypothetical protein K6632_13200 [Escherichia coli]|nr:hypothetical protein [Escherichia coli]
MSRLITLQDWAKEEFGDLAPSERVLKKYAQGKMMAPPAIKVREFNSEVRHPPTQLGSIPRTPCRAA